MNLTKEHIGKRVKRKGNLGYDNVNDVLVNIDRFGSAEFSGGESYEATDLFGVWELVEEKKEHKMDKQKVLDAVNKLSCDKQAVITIIEEATGEKLKRTYTSQDTQVGTRWLDKYGQEHMLTYHHEFNYAMLRLDASLPGYFSISPTNDSGMVEAINKHGYTKKA